MTARSVVYIRGQYWRPLSASSRNSLSLCKSSSFLSFLFFCRTTLLDESAARVNSCGQLGRGTINRRLEAFSCFILLLFFFALFRWRRAISYSRNRCRAIPGVNLPNSNFIGLFCKLVKARAFNFMDKFTVPQKEALDIELNLSVISKRSI